MDFIECGNTPMSKIPQREKCANTLKLYTTNIWYNIDSNILTLYINSSKRNE